MPKSRKKQEKLTSVLLKDGTAVSLGDLVGYYLGGWRTGHLEEIKGSELKIRPIGPKDHAPVRLVKVTADFLKRVV